MPAARSRAGDRPIDRGDVMYCSACGKEVPADARFCHNCGAAVGPVEAAAFGSPTEAAGDATLAQPPITAAASPPFMPVPPPTGEPAVTPSAATLPPTIILAPVAPAGGQYPSGPRTVGSDSAQGGQGAPSGPGYLSGSGGPNGPAGPGGPVGGQQGKSRRGLWIAIAVLAVAVIAVAVAVPLVLARGGDESPSSSTTTTSVAESSTTTSTTEQTTSTTEAETSTTSSSSTTLISGDPGDSAGEWVEMEIPEMPGSVMEVSVSDNILLMATRTDAASQLYAYDLTSGDVVELPIEASEMGGTDVDGYTAVWWEGEYDEASNTFSDQHIYSYEMPDGPRVEIAGGGRNVYYPQTAGLWVSWIEESPWEASPEEYWRTPIYGSILPDADGTANEPMELAPSAIASIMGDAVWVYSLGERYLAWEQAAADGGLESGTYVLDLSDLAAQPRLVGSEAWRPSIGGNKLVYWENGLKAFDLASGDRWDVDPEGDFPTAAPTFAAYFRPIDSSDGNTYEIVARGLNGNYEQVLARQPDPPWLSPFIAASGSHIAFVANNTLHVFEWKGQ